LHELISLAVASSMQSKKVWGVYNSIISLFGNEFNILLDVSREELIKKGINEKLVELIIRNREEKIKVKPGYDGVYGEALLPEKQSRLF